MSTEKDLIENLTTLNSIVEALNRAVDVHSVLNDALGALVRLMGLESGWIFLKDPAAQDRWGGNGFVLAAHHNLPPALDLENADAWQGGCLCQDRCKDGCGGEAYNEVQCSRLAGVSGDRRGLAVHASTPLRSGDRILGILNVAGPDWNSFRPQALMLLSNVGNHMGAALERARLFDLLHERHVHEQAALLHFSDQLLKRLNLDDLMEYLVEEVQGMLEADACALLLPGEQPGFLEFRAASGWRLDPGAERRQVPADERSGPGLVMRTRRPLLAGDLGERDPTPWAPAWLLAEGFRGHAVAPLLVEDRSVGALVIDQRQPRQLHEDDMRFLCLMANQAAVAIEKARLHEEEVKAEALEKDLALARQIQLSLLPQAPPVVAGWDFAAFYQAARVVGGDFYDFFVLPGQAGGQDGRLGLVVADVAGKGVPAALFMARSSTLIRGACLGGRSPAAALTRANELILQDRRSQLFLTAFYGVLDTRSGRLVYANAGHNRPLWLQAGTGQFQELAAPGIVLGMLEEIELEERTVDLAPGDLVVFYTDGVTEAMDARGEQFGQERLHEVVTASSGASAQEVLDVIVDAVQVFAGGVPLSDDVTIFVAKRSRQGLRGAEADRSGQEPAGSKELAN